MLSGDEAKEQAIMVPPPAAAAAAAAEIAAAEKAEIENLDRVVGADPEDENDVIPHRFVNGVLGDMTEARRRWQVTKVWRREELVDDIFNQPQPNFALIKKWYPHGFHKMSKEGNYLYYELPGQAKISRIWKAGLTMDDLLRHYVFITEFMWRNIEPKEDGMVISIFDVGGCSLSDLAGNTLKLFQRCADVIGSHYPERSKAMYVVRSPWWFQAGFAIVSPFIDPRTKKKISVLGNSKQFSKILNDLFVSEDLPKEFGGTDVTPLGESDIEIKMREHVKRVNAEHDVPFDPEFCMSHVRSKMLGLKSKSFSSLSEDDAEQNQSKAEKQLQELSGSGAPPPSGDVAT